MSAGSEVSPPGLPPSAQSTAQSAALEAAVAALPGPVAVAFRHVADVLGPSPALATLLEKGALTQSDGEKTVIERLRDLTDRPRAQGLDGAQLTLQTVNVLADPDSAVYQGLNTYTCAAANVERELAQNPSLFTRVVDGLSSPAGQAALELARVPGSEQEDTSGRNLVNRLVQGALMASGGAVHGAYDPLKDSFEDGSGSGLKPLETAALVARLEGQDQAVVIHDGGTHAEFRKLVESVDQPFQIGATWNGKDHMLWVQGHSDGQARYYDPAQPRAGTMPLADLLFKTQFAIFSRPEVAGFQFPEDAVYWANLSKQEEAPTP